MDCRHAFDNFCEGVFRIAERHAILRPLWTGHSGLYRTEIKLQRAVEVRSGSRVGAEEHLLFAVSFDERYLRSRPRCETQIVECLGIDGKETHGGAVFRGHVSDSGAMGNTQG